MSSIQPADELLHKTKPRWPVVIGVVSILLSCLFILFESLRVFVWMVRRDEPMSPVELMVISLFLNLLLIAGSIRLIWWKPGGRTFLIVWAWLDLIVTIVQVVLLEAKRARVDFDLFPLDTLIFFAVAEAYPIFLLIWMSRKFVKRDLREFVKG